MVRQKILQVVIAHTSIYRFGNVVGINGYSRHLSGRIITDLVRLEIELAFLRLPR